MGDKQRSESQKPVKNTLLSGASHGFPFENFQGNSMLIPVSQDSPSVLNDSAADIDPIGNRAATNDSSIEELIHGVGASGLEGKTSTEEPKKEPSPSSNQGYTGIFSSLFRGNSQSKQESDIGPSQQKKTDQPLQSFESGNCPYPSSVTIPSVQSFSPALQVPAASTNSPEKETSSNSIGFVHSTEPPFQQPQRSWARGQNADVSSNVPNSPDGTFPSVPAEFDSFQSLQTSTRQCEIQNFFMPQSPASGVESESFSSVIGFEPYNDLRSKAGLVGGPPGATLYKAQSAFELAVAEHAEPSLTSEAFVNSSHLLSPTSSGRYFNRETRAGSVDSFNSNLPRQSGVPPPRQSVLSQSSSAPPVTSGMTGKTFRRDHHKRLAYAQVPGLTSNTAVSSHYLTLSQNFPSYSSLSSSAVTSPSSSSPSSSSSSSKSALFSSLSQPVFVNLSSSGVSVNVDSSTTSTTSLHNYFSPNYASPNSRASQTTIDTVETSSDSSRLSSPPPESSAQIPISQTFSPHPITFSVTNNFSMPPSVTNMGYFVSPVSVHPTIMSTKEQTTTSGSSSTPPGRPSSPPVIPASLNNLANLGHSGIIYRPAYCHWFLRIETKDGKEIWQPFSMTDSLALEQAFNSVSLTPDSVVPTDGGRYDVNVTARLRTAAYWEEKPKKVMRCSWFYKSTTESRLYPYDEDTAYNLEEEYKKAVTTNTWNRKVDLPNGSYVIMYGPSSLALFQSAPQTPEGWEAETDFSGSTSHRPKIVKRGVLDDFEIDDGETSSVDHLIFVVHGIGSVCDFKFRTIEEAVDGFRGKCLQLIKSHFKTSVERGTVNRVEILPVSWHGHLHGEATGVDKKLQTITLKSIPRLRHFTNDTLLDILFYTSPVYCQNIMQQVGREINTLFAKFKSRNPNFKGGVSLVGHSLGSLILFDMLCHQKPLSPCTGNGNVTEASDASAVDQDASSAASSEKRKPTLSHKVSYVIGRAGTGQPYIEYPQLSFQPVAFFAMGSPIGMFVTVRGIDSLGMDFSLPTCSRFFNIFHPFDPVAYRIEALINPELSEKRPVLIPHHKGRKRMHLELKETVARVGADLKQRLIDSVRSTWNTVYQLTLFGRADDELEQEVNQVIEKQLERQQNETVAQCLNECYDTEFDAGRLNLGRRVDYVLQEAPLESFNEYVSALTSHVIYWDSEDTMLLILKEVYGSAGISPDNQLSGVPGPSEDPSPSAGPYNPNDVASKSLSFVSQQQQQHGYQ